MKVKVLIKDKTLTKKLGRGQKCVKAWSFPRQPLPPYLFVLGGQKCKFSDELKIPKGSISHLFDAYYFRLYSMRDQKPVSTPDFAIRILTISSLSWLLSTGMFCLEDLSQPWEHFLYTTGGSLNFRESLHLFESIIFTKNSINLLYSETIYSP